MTVELWMVACVLIGVIGYVLGLNRCLKREYSDGINEMMLALENNTKTFNKLITCIIGKAKEPKA